MIYSITKNTPGGKKMKALFGRKVVDLAELKALTKRDLKEGYKGQEYKVIREVSLDAKVFEAFAEDFLEDQPWITKEDGGMNKAGEILCIRVINKDTGEKVLVNSEGYDYPRYTAIEK